MDCRTTLQWHVDTMNGARTSGEHVRLGEPTGQCALLMTG